MSQAFGIKEPIQKLNHDNQGFVGQNINCDFYSWELKANNTGGTRVVIVWEEEREVRTSWDTIVRLYLLHPSHTDPPTAHATCSQQCSNLFTGSVWPMIPLVSTTRNENLKCTPSGPPGPCSLTSRSHPNVSWSGTVTQRGADADGRWSSKTRGAGSGKWSGAERRNCRPFEEDTWKHGQGGRSPGHLVSVVTTKLCMLMCQLTHF